MMVHLSFNQTNSKLSIKFICEVENSLNQGSNLSFLNKGPVRSPTLRNSLGQGIEEVTVHPAYAPAILNLPLTPEAQVDIFFHRRAELCGLLS